MRKWFHMLALLVYFPGLALEPDMLALGSSLFVFLFFVAEVSQLIIFTFSSTALQNYHFTTLLQGYRCRVNL